jgi:hypothetical protein
MNASIRNDAIRRRLAKVITVGAPAVDRTCQLDLLAASPAIAEGFQ